MKKPLPPGIDHAMLLGHKRRRAAVPAEETPRQNRPEHSAPADKACSWCGVTYKLAELFDHEFACKVRRATDPDKPTGDTRHRIV